MPNNFMGKKEQSELFQKMADKINEGIKIQTMAAGYRDFLISDRVSAHCNNRANATVPR